MCAQEEEETAQCIDSHSLVTLPSLFFFMFHHSPLSNYTHIQPNFLLFQNVSDPHLALPVLFATCKFPSLFGEIPFILEVPVQTSLPLCPASHFPAS